MATLDKLFKAFDALKVGQPHEHSDVDVVHRKKEPLTSKEKIIHCTAIADSITSPSIRSSPDFPKFLGVSMETFLMCCDDEDADVRMVADECLNRTIKTLLETNLGRLQVELYKEIKKNGTPRTLRAALWRFADLCHLIRPQKCRPYVINMLPNIYQIILRPEESVQETLAAALAKICPVFGKFTNDGETTTLLKSFLPNLKSTLAVFRRTAASCLTSICQNSRKPALFFAWLLNALIEMLIPVSPEKNHAPSLLGAMLCLRHMIPYMMSDELSNPALRGSFGVRHKEPEVHIGLDHLIQMYEVLLYYTQHSDHNVVTTALEALQQLLQTPPALLLGTLLSPKGILRTRIYMADIQELGLLKTGDNDFGSLHSLTPEDTGIEEDIQVSEISSHLGTSSFEDSPTMESDNPSAVSSMHFPDDELTDQMSYVSVDDDEKFQPYSNIRISKIRDSSLTHAGSVGTLSRSSPKRKQALKKGVSDDKIGDNSEEDYAWEEGTPSVSPGIEIPFQIGNIGVFTDPSCPLVYCTRLLCSSFLLTGCKGRLMPDKNVRVSVKSLALGCISAIIQLQPNIFFLPLFKPEDNEDSSLETPSQSIRDVLLFAHHTDPQLRGCAAQLISSLLKSGLRESSGKFDNWSQSHGSSPESIVTLQHLTDILLKLLRDDSSVTCRLSIASLNACLIPILHSDHSPQGMRILNALLQLANHPYWLVKAVLLELLADIPFKITYFLETRACELDIQLSYNQTTYFQEHVFTKVMIPLLGDEDSRVRQAAAVAISRMIPRLFYPVDHSRQDPIIALAKERTDAYLDPIMQEGSLVATSTIPGLIRPYDTSKVKILNTAVELALSRIVDLLVQTLISSRSKFMTIGCCHSLCLLSEEYLVTVYPYAWACDLAPSQGTHQVTAKSLSPSATGMKEEMNNTPSSSCIGLTSLVLSLVTNTTIAMDLTVHQQILQLVGNLFAGLSLKTLTPKPEVPPENSPPEDEKWSMLSDKRVASLAEQLLTHLMRLLNVFAHVIEDVTPVIPPTKTALPSLPSAPSLSPIKRKNKTKDDLSVSGPASNLGTKPNLGKSYSMTEKDDKVEKEKLTSKPVGSTHLGTFYGLPHYLRFFDVVRAAFSNYKLSLDMQSSERFSALLNNCLITMSKVLEILTVVEIGDYAEELLGYLKNTVTMEPKSTILCVQQLLKALFSTNLCSLWEGPQNTNASRKSGRTTRLTVSINPGLYHYCFTAPYTQLMQSLSDTVVKATSVIESEESSTSWLSWVRKKSEKKLANLFKSMGRSGDKSSLASYIRLFEPLVIKALKQYTITSSVELHCQVLNLLSQLVQLRVNYCLLDSDQIFIGFIIKQFEFIEEGQIPHTELLLPCIFHFLVLLSYERYHSKLVIGVPKIIQLCDGIMASGQPPKTHAIPALMPVVEDLFLIRGIVNKADAGKELDTQREVIISMLLRLIYYHEVLEMFILILQQYRKESEDKWKKLSRQIIDIVFPLLAKQQIILESQTALDVLHRLFEVVAQSVFRPVDIILKIMFSPPHNLSTLSYVQRWVCMILAMLRILIAQSKEEVVLGRLTELNLHITIFTDTIHMHQSQDEIPNTLPPHPGFLTHSSEETIARLLLQVIGVVSAEIRHQSYTPSIPSDKCQFLCQQLAHLLLYIMHMFQSGIYRRVANVCMTLIKNDTPPGFFSVHDINRTFLELAPYYPTLTLQWCNVLILLNFDDQDFWSDVMRTPVKRTVPVSRLNSETGKSVSSSIHLEMLRTGGLILFCDYVCENLTDAEHMTWIIVNHVNELIYLSSEPPVQDLIGAIHRNSAASGLFVQAIQARCENLSKPNFAKRILSCLEAIHESQSGALIMLIINKLMVTHHLAVVQASDALVCRRIEWLLAEPPDEGVHQLPLTDLTKHLELLQSSGVARRHTRLETLLLKLKNHCFVKTLDSEVQLTTQKFSPVSVSLQNIKDAVLNKEWYLDIVRKQCFSSYTVGKECAQLLAKLDYEDIMAIMSSKEFNLTFLEDCLLHGVDISISEFLKDNKGLLCESPIPASPPPVGPESPLHRAAVTILLQHIDNIVKLMPRPHQIFLASDNAVLMPKELKYHNRLIDLFNDTVLWDILFQITPVVTRYLSLLPNLPWPTEVPAESLGDLGRFCIICLEAMHWLVEKETHPCPQQLQIALNAVHTLLRNQSIAGVIGLRDHVSWVCSSVFSIHRIMTFVLGEESLLQMVSSGMKKGVIDPENQRINQACDLAASLLLWLENNSGYQSSLPQFLDLPLKSIIIGLARLPPVNSHSRTPPLVWQMGWSPESSGNSRLSIPPLPINFLQEQDVLKQFIFRVNTLGWTSRQQFEETWMALLGVISATPIGSGNNAEEEMERIQTSCLAVKCITVLLLQTLLLPQPGNPQNSNFLHQKRDKPLAFLHTRCGKKLSIVRNIVQQKLQVMVMQNASESEVNPFLEVHDVNLERKLCPNKFGLGQVSLEYLWTATGLLEEPFLEEIGRVAIGSVEFHQREQCLAASGLDIHSCLHFLLDLYTQWMSVGSNPRTPLPLLLEAVRSIVQLSDIFTERNQFEWMLETLTEVQKTHPTEDDIMNAYLTVGICKGAAVTGMDMAMAERYKRILETNLKSSHLPSRICALHGLLYLLEHGSSEETLLFLSLAIEYLQKHLENNYVPSNYSEQYVLLMWTVAFYIMENFHKDIQELDFSSNILQLSLQVASSPDDTYPIGIYVLIIHGLERLLLAEVITGKYAEILVKFSVDKFCQQNPIRAFASLSLMLSCMYTGKEKDKWSPTALKPEVEQTEKFNIHTNDAESLIVAMERVTVLFDRIKKGYPYEAEIIARVLPIFLMDFFPLSDIMNKVIGEFISNQQPHPQLLAYVVFQVFENVYLQSQQPLIQEWVMLSLSNFTQRSPVSMAIWSLTCFFTSASTNCWIRALFPYVQHRIGKLEVFDRELFCLTAVDFCNQLMDKSQQRIFRQTFASVAQPDTPYADLLNCL